MCKYKTYKHFYENKNIFKKTELITTTAYIFYEFNNNNKDISSPGILNKLLSNDVMIIIK